MEEKKVRRVMIATPTMDGRVDVLYADSLVQSMRAGAAAGIDVSAVYLPGDALLVRARNELAAIAVKACVDDVVFIDSDIAWTPQGFMRVLMHDEPFVGALYRQKSDNQVLVYKPMEGARVRDDGLLETRGVGFGFVRLRRDALLALWKRAAIYDDGKEGRMLFEVYVDRGQLIGEDIAVCRKWLKMRGKVYVDTVFTVAHTGPKLYTIQSASGTLPEG